jgi:hypothetical protein
MDNIIKIEENKIWQAIIVISVFLSVFGPPVAIIMNATLKEMLLLIFLSNFLFIFDILIKSINHKKKYVVSLDFLIDFSAVISAVMEFLLVLGYYQGPMIANLRIVRSFRLVGRFSKSVKAIINFGKIGKSDRNINALLYNNKSGGNKELIFVNTLKAKFNSIFMLLMSYIILRYSSNFDLLDKVAKAKAEIWFFLEIIFIMLITGFFIDYYLNKLLSERFGRIMQWVDKKSQENLFFRDVHNKALNSYDEVSFLEKYIGIIFERLNEFPYALRKFIWGKFKPSVNQKIIFLSDIENYSSRTANMSAEQINQFLDSYVKDVVNILVAHNAEIDKYVGDSIIAFFDINNADGAVKASIKISKNKIKTRVGLYMDKVYETAVGPHGYKQLDHFSEGISIAQRLEDHNKKTKTKVLIAEEVYVLLSNKTKKELKFFGRFKPKGAKRIIRYYTIK